MPNRLDLLAQRTDCATMLGYNQQTITNPSLRQICIEWESSESIKWMMDNLFALYPGEDLVDRILKINRTKGLGLIGNIIKFGEEVNPPGALIFRWENGTEKLYLSNLMHKGINKIFNKMFPNQSTRAHRARVLWCWATSFVQKAHPGE